MPRVYVDICEVDAERLDLADLSHLRIQLEKINLCYQELGLETRDELEEDLKDDLAVLAHRFNLVGFEYTVNDTSILIRPKELQ